MAFPLPLFPLPVVLYPGTRLPLHLFEPRYRRLLRDVLAADRRFVLVPPGDGDAPPPIGSAGCIATITEVTPRPDGRSDILTAGGPRCRLEAILEAEVPYFMGSVEPFEDVGPEPEATEMASLREALRRYLAVLEAWDDPELPDAWLDDPAGYTFQVAAVAHLDWTAKQHLLEMTASRDRARLLTELLPAVTARLAAAVAARRHAAGNGRIPTAGSPPGGV